MSLATHFTKIRSAKLFEIVAEYPESSPSLKELKQTASLTNSMGYVGKVFRGAVQRRLLHLGASTAQILVTTPSFLQIIYDLLIVHSVDRTSTCP